MKELGFTTRALRADIPRVEQLPLSPPIYPASTYAFDDIDSFADVARRKTSGGYLYSRWANPTTDALARTIASLEGADASACFASGMAAISTTLASLVSSGDHIVSATQLYGGTHGLMAGLHRSGVVVSQESVADLAALEAAFTPATKVLYAETLGNPTMEVADLDALSVMARNHGALLVVDATFTPPCALRPIEHGADLVIHALTKYLGGHSDLMGGVVSGKRDRIEAVRALQIETGAILGPFESWLCSRGIQTLALRWERISDNAAAIARALTQNPSVERVLYPGLPTHPRADLAKRLMGERVGGVLSFEVTGGLAAGRRFLERVRVAHPAASLGGTKTLVVHPASVTHTQLDEVERRAAGITDGTIRMSVGIEDLPDLIADIEQALA